MNNVSFKKSNFTYSINLSSFSTYPNQANGDAGVVSEGNENTINISRTGYIDQYNNNSSLLLYWDDGSLTPNTGKTLREINFLNENKKVEEFDKGKFYDIDNNSLSPYKSNVSYPTQNYSVETDYHSFLLSSFPFENNSNFYGIKDSDTMKSVEEYLINQAFNVKNISEAFIDTTSRYSSLFDPEYSQRIARAGFYSNFYNISESMEKGSLDSVYSIFSVLSESSLNTGNLKFFALIRGIPVEFKPFKTSSKAAIYRLPENLFLQNSEEVPFSIEKIIYWNNTGSNISLYVGNNSTFFFGINNFSNGTLGNYNTNYTFSNLHFYSYGNYSETTN